MLPREHIEWQRFQWQLLRQWVIDLWCSSLTCCSSLSKPPPPQVDVDTILWAGLDLRCVLVWLGCMESARPGDGELPGSRALHAASVVTHSSCSEMDFWICGTSTVFSRSLNRRWSDRLLLGSVDASEVGRVHLHPHDVARVLACSWVCSFHPLWVRSFSPAVGQIPVTTPPSVGHRLDPSLCLQASCLGTIRSSGTVLFAEFAGVGAAVGCLTPSCPSRPAWRSFSWRSTSRLVANCSLTTCCALSAGLTALFPPPRAARRCFAQVRSGWGLERGHERASRVVEGFVSPSSTLVISLNVDASVLFCFGLWVRTPAKLLEQRSALLLDWQRGLMVRRACTDRPTSGGVFLALVISTPSACSSWGLLPHSTGTFMTLTTVRCASFVFKPLTQ